jgi:hypothetical protein
LSLVHISSLTIPVALWTMFLLNSESLRTASSQYKGRKLELIPYSYIPESSGYAHEGWASNGPQPLGGVFIDGITAVGGGRVRIRVSKFYVLLLYLTYYFLHRMPQFTFAQERLLLLLARAGLGNRLYLTCCGRSPICLFRRAMCGFMEGKCENGI